jgi:hypothetical protein
MKLVHIRLDQWWFFQLGIVIEVPEPYPIVQRDCRKKEKYSKVPEDNWWRLTVKVIEYERISYISLGIVIVTNATSDRAQDRIQTRRRARKLMTLIRTIFPGVGWEELTYNPEACRDQRDEWMACDVHCTVHWAQSRKGICYRCSKLSSRTRRRVVTSEGASEMPTPRHVRIKSEFK